MVEKIKRWLSNNLKGDPVLWAIVILLSLVSIMVVYSASGSLAYKKNGGNTEHYLMKHGMLMFLSFVVMWYAHKLNYKYYARLSKLGVLVSIPMLVLAFAFGSKLNDANRWITIPLINQSFQPSDFAKLSLIAYLASVLARNQNNIDDWKKSFVPVLMYSGIICGLIALANLSTALILFSTCMLLMFIGRVPMKYLLMLALSGILVGTVALSFGQRGRTALKRLAVFFNPDDTQKYESIPFQAEQSYIAIWNGGLLGKGPGNSDQKNFLPHSYSDFIYSIIIEEYGFIGGLFILFLYLALLYRGMKVAANSDRAFGGLLSAGLAFGLVIQAMINMGVAVGVGPITGQPLPLLSMGGTSLLFTGLSLGIILSVSRGDIVEEIATDE
ncbi:MAG: ftsW [Chitinophagaceae bacterium]|nr:ftsW [Chitinophagaceae bacterium]